MIYPLTSFSCHSFQAKFFARWFFLEIIFESYANLWNITFYLVFIFSLYLLYLRCKFSITFLIWLIIFPVICLYYWFSCLYCQYQFIFRTRLFVMRLINFQRVPNQSLIKILSFNFYLSFKNLFEKQQRIFSL